MALDLTPADVDATVRTVAGEAANQPPEGQRAVAHVIVNRSLSSGQPPAAVVSAPGQFEAWNDPKTQNLDPASPLYRRTLATVLPVLSGDHEDPTGGADHYLNPKLQSDLGRPQPAWSKGGDGQQIGDHVFYKTGYQHPGGGTAPPVAALYQSMGLGPDGKPPTAAPSAAAAAPSDDAPPPIDQILKGAGYTGTAPPPPPPAPVSPGLTKARQEAQATYGKSFNSPTGALANSMWADFAPVLTGGAEAARTFGQNMLSKVGIGQPAGYSPGEAFQAAREASSGALENYGQEHPIANTAANIAGFVASGPEQLVARGGEKLALKAVPKLAESGLGRAAARVAGYGDAAALAGTGQGLSEGKPIPGALAQGAETGVAALPFGALGEGAGALSGLAKNPATRAAIPFVGSTLGGAGIGAVTGYATGGPKGAEQGALAGGQAGATLGAFIAAHKATNPEAVLPTPMDRNAALDLVAKSANPDTVSTTPHPGAASTLQEADPLHTTAEALGDTGNTLLGQASARSEEPTKAVQSAISTRQEGTRDRIVTGLRTATGIDPEAAGLQVADATQQEQQGLQQKAGRITPTLASGLRDATEVDPATAQQDIGAQIDAQKNGVAKPLWDAIDMQAPVNNPEVTKALGQPLVRQALNKAVNDIGDEGMKTGIVENPDAAKTADGRPTISAEDYRSWLAGGVNDPNLLIKPDTITSHLPTAEAVIKTQRYLASNVIRDPITGEVAPDAQYPGNSDRLKWAGRLNEIIKRPDVIPGLAEAKDASGDYLSAADAHEFGRKAGRGMVSSQDVVNQVGGMTPGEQQAARTGYMREVYNKLEKSPDFNPESLQTDYHQAVQKHLFGSEGAQRVQEQLGAAAQVRDQAQNGGPIQASARNGQNLWSGGRTDKDLALVRQRFDASTPQQQDIERRAYLAQMQQRLDNGQLKPAAVLASHFHKEVMGTLFGPEGAKGILDTLRREVALAESAKAVKPIRVTAPAHGDEALSGAVFGAGEGPHGMVRGALGGLQLKGLRATIQNIKEAHITPGVRSALGEVLAQSPQDTAEQIRMRHSAMKAVPLSRSTLASQIGRAALPGLAVAGGTGTVHALSGLGPSQ